MWEIFKFVALVIFAATRNRQRVDMHRWLVQRGGQHGIIKAVWRIAIKDYRRENVAATFVLRGDAS